MKNILIVGSPRVGKSNLASKISKELGYIYIELDNIFESIEKLKCWPYPKYHDAKIISSELSSFVINFINHLNKENHYVIEGAYIDIQKIYNKLDNVEIIGLTYNNLSKETLFQRIKEYDSNTWVSVFDDETLLEKCKCFIKRNKYYHDIFKELNIKEYDLSDKYELTMSEIVNDLKKLFISSDVEIIIDRPIGSKHPKYDMIYEVNYGYVPNTKSDDGEELDCYLLGVKEKVERFKGTCIGIVKRMNDNDDKLIITPKGTKLTNEEIEKMIYFQEKYFKHTIIRRRSL